MALSLEVSHPQLVLVLLVLTVVSPPITLLSRAHPVTMALQMSMDLVPVITRSSPPQASLEALLVALAASLLVRKEQTIS